MGADDLWSNLDGLAVEAAGSGELAEPMTEHAEQEWEGYGPDEGVETKERTPSSVPTVAEGARTAAEFGHEMDGHAAQPWEDYEPTNTSPSSDGQGEDDSEMNYESAARREASILAAMQTADWQTKVALGRELDEIRTARTRLAERTGEVDFASAIVRDHLTPVATHTMHSAATDWLADDTISFTASDMSRKMAAEATVWWNKVSEAVKTYPDELFVQARGMASRLGSQYGLQSEAATLAFMEHVEHLHHLAAEKGSHEQGGPGTIADESGQGVSELPKEVTPSGRPEVFDNFQPSVHPMNSGAHGDKSQGTPQPGAGQTASRRIALKYKGQEYVTGMARADATCVGCDTSISKGTEAWVQPVGGSDSKVMCRWCGKDAQKSARRRTAADARQASRRPFAGSRRTASGDSPKERLEYLRQEIQNERISYGEISELQDLVDHIDPGDVELLQWAGVPEFKESSRRIAAEGMTCSVCGDKIASDGDENGGYHHDNGEKHDHEAKPGGDSDKGDSGKPWEKESSRRTALMAQDCPSTKDGKECGHNKGHSGPHDHGDLRWPNEKESARRTAGWYVEEKQDESWEPSKKTGPYDSREAADAARQKMDSPGGYYVHELKGHETRYEKGKKVGNVGEGYEAPGLVNGGEKPEQGWSHADWSDDGDNPAVRVEERTPTYTSARDVGQVNYDFDASDFLGKTFDVTSCLACNSPGRKLGSSAGVDHFACTGCGVSYAISRQAAKSAEEMHEWYGEDYEDARETEREVRQRAKDKKKSSRAAAKCKVMSGEVDSMYECGCSECGGLRDQGAYGGACPEPGCEWFTARGDRDLADHMDTHHYARRTASKYNSVDEYIRAVDQAIGKHVGLGAYDLADQPYADWWQDGVSPAEAAQRALEYEGFPFGASRTAAAPIADESGRAVSQLPQVEVQDNLEPLDHLEEPPEMSTEQMGDYSMGVNAQRRTAADAIADESGQAVSQVPQVEVMDALEPLDHLNDSMLDSPVIGESGEAPAEGAANVADVPTPGAGVADYPQPTASRQARLNLFRQNVQANLARS